MELQHWVKTSTGQEVIDTQKPFCIDGKIWQGWQKCAIRVEEKQLSNEELGLVLDVDGTLHTILTERRSRLEARMARKMAEYDERRIKLRRERSAIRESIKEDKALGIPAAPDDLQQIKRINDRLARLQQQEEDASLETLKKLEISSVEEHERAHMEMQETSIECPECGKVSPPGKKPEAWLRGHMAGAHRGPRTKEAKQADREAKPNHDLQGTA